MVPSYRRPDDLRCCLAALISQTAPMHEVIVVHRRDDGETCAVLDALPANALPLKRAYPQGPGVVSAYNRGIEASTGEIIAFTDDDAAPQPQWVARITVYFRSNPDIAGVGGRDRLHVEGKLVAGRTNVVGKVQWFGRTVGNHHTGFGPARQIDVLKGVNMSFRRTALGKIRFDQRLLGPGAQVDCEMALCLALRRQGAVLVYDPDIVVDHYTAPRHDIDQRHGFNAAAQFNQAHNETVALLEHLPPLRRLAFLAWATLLGTRAVPGIGQALRLPLLRIGHPCSRIIASLRGRWAGVQTWRGRTSHAANPSHVEMLDAVSSLDRRKTC